MTGSEPTGDSSGISVVIPAYNAEATIVKCLDSIRSQEVPASEVIVVDDGSTDRTREMAQDLATVMSNTRRKGAGGARNTGANAALGKILAFTDSDCVLPECWLGNIRRAFEEEGVGAVAGGYHRALGTGFVGRFACIELARRRKGFGAYVETAPSNNFAVLADLYREVGGFPEIFAGATLEDMVFSFRVGRRARIRWLPGNGVDHHFRPTIRGYLSQQFAFGRDTVVAYFAHPELFFAKTHQGSQIPIELLVFCCILLAGIIYWPGLILGLCMIWILNLPLLSDCLKQEGVSFTVKALMFIPLRDFFWLVSVLAGLARVCLHNMGFVKPRMPGKT